MEFREPFQPSEVVKQGPPKAETAFDPETARLLESLDRYVNREFREREQMSFSDELDEIEIRNALIELRFKYVSHPDEFDPNFMAERQREAVIAYHTRFQDLEKFAGISPQELHTQSLSQNLDYLLKVKKLLLELKINWDDSVYAFIGRRERKEGKYISTKEKFGGFFPDTRFLFNTSSEAKEQLLQQYPELAEAYRRFHIDRYPNLQRRLQETEQTLDARTREHPEEIRALLLQLHASEDKIDSEVIDDLLGIAPQNIERSIDICGLKEKYGYEQYPYQGTPYEFIRTFVKDLNLSPNDVLYDLGCGYGRIPLYGAMTTEAQYRGIEIVPERVVEAIAIKDKFALGNVEFRQGNVLEQNYADGSVFFLFNPFTKETLEQVGEKLEKLTKTKRIRVVSLGPSTSYFQSQKWLQPVETGSNKHPWDLTIFESK